MNKVVLNYDVYYERFRDYSTSSVAVDYACFETSSSWYYEDIIDISYLH